jgi:hypothetical protein
MELLFTCILCCVICAGFILVIGAQSDIVAAEKRKNEQLRKEIDCLKNCTEIVHWKCEHFKPDECFSCTKYGCKCQFEK